MPKWALDTALRVCYARGMPGNPTPLLTAAEIGLDTLLKSPTRERSYAHNFGRELGVLDLTEFVDPKPISREPEALKRVTARHHTMLSCSRWA